MKCTICNKESDKMAKVIYHFHDPESDFCSYYCVFFNQNSCRWQIKHRGVIAKTRNISEGNIKWVEIEGIGY